jgi:hypothetical protein
VIALIPDADIVVVSREPKYLRNLRLALEFCLDKTYDDET